MRSADDWHTSHHDSYASETNQANDKTEVQNNAPAQETLNIYGYRLIGSEIEARFDDIGNPLLRIGTSGKIRLFGYGLNKHFNFVLTKKKGPKGGHCEFPVGDMFEVNC